MPTNNVKMIVNPTLLKNHEEDILMKVADDQRTLAECDAMDTLLHKLYGRYAEDMTLGELALRNNYNRQRATDSLAKVLVPAPVKRKKRKYTRRKPVSPLVATIPAKAKAKKKAVKKAVKKNVYKGR